MADEQRPKKPETPVGRSAATLSQDRDVAVATDKMMKSAEREAGSVPHPLGAATFAEDARIADRYVVIEELGRGGMSVVYLARDEKIHRLVAVKVLSAQGSPNAGGRIAREASASNALDAARVARIFDVGETSTGEPFLVMEYVPGRTVRSLLRNGRVEPGEALRIVREVAVALGQAHRAGLVHRDVKPDNVMVCEDGRVVLLDFGIVKFLASGESAVPFATQLTTKGAIVGTPAYLSPEQALGRAVGAAADQFALAVTAFELLSGSVPWRATEMTPMLAEVLQGDPRPLRGGETEFPAAMEAALGRALSKNPEERFPSIEKFAAALQSASDGVLVDRLAPGARRAVTMVALFCGLAAIGSFAVARNRLSRRATAPVEDSARVAVAALSEPDGFLACPIFEVHGVPDVAVRLGAAAAAATCTRAAWFLGGRNDRILSPAALLDVPRTPVADFPDPYEAPEQRGRTVELARSRAAAYVDGTISNDGGSWSVSLVLRAPDASEIAKASGRDAKFFAAIRQGLLQLWHSPLVTREIDPDVSRWTGFPDAVIGGIYADETAFWSNDGCDEIHRRGNELGNVLPILDDRCKQSGRPGTLVTGPHPIDESSPWALATSALAYRSSGDNVPPAEARRLAVKLEELYHREASRIGRVRLAEVGCGFWEGAREGERAQAACLLAVHEDPLSWVAWDRLVLAAQETGSVIPTASTASAWCPDEVSHLQAAHSARRDDLALRLRDARLAYLLEPFFQHAMVLGHTLAEAGREDEARALATGPLDDDPRDNAALKSYILAAVELRTAKLARGIEQLEAAGDIGTTDLVVAARVAGHTTKEATKWAAAFLTRSDAEASVTATGYLAPMVLCMDAPRDLAIRCLDRVTRLGQSTMNWWSDEGLTLLKGATRYAAGDLRGATAIWRPLVRSTDAKIVGLLPTEAFERAGQPDLAARLDARKLSYTFIAGVSEAAPREAKRALAAGDKARAKDLAEKVVRAWEEADVEVPAVSEMRLLLGKL